MIAPETLATILTACAVAAGGMAVGLAYFHALAGSVDVLVSQGKILHAAGLTLLRVGGAVVVLTGLAQFGAVVLLSGFAGFLAARAVATARAKRAG